MGSWITLNIWLPSGSLETWYMLNRGCLCNQPQIKTLNPEPQWTFLVYNISHLGAPLLPGEIKCVLWTPLGDALWEHLLNFFCTSPHRFFFFFLISWRPITSQHRSSSRHTLTWISHEFTCIPHPDPPSHLPLHLIPLGLPSAPGPSTCLMHPTWAGDLFHPR